MKHREAKRAVSGRRLSNEKNYDNGYRTSDDY